MDDAQILFGLKSRDAQAFKSLFNLLFTPIRHYCERIIGNEQEAEDIAMSTFTELWKRLETEDKGKDFENILHVKNFVYSVARNASLNYLKSIRVRQKLQEQIIYLTPKSEEFLTEKSRYEVEMIQNLYKELDKLAPQTREVFKRVFLLNIPRDEVARQLKISKSTVHVHCSKAYKELRQIFSERELLAILLLINFCNN